MSDRDREEVRDERETARGRGRRADTPVDLEPPPSQGALPSPDGVPIADLRRYRVIGELAHGGLGRILEVEDRTLGRKVAIKELRVPGIRSQARFLREAMVTARLQHPSIVALYDVGRWQSGEPYYAMKLVAGRALDAVIARARTLDERLALTPHVIAVADAIAYAHSQRIIHRDLKPANVLVGDFGETVVIDWGLAKDLADDTDHDTALGTPAREATAGSPLTVAGEVLGTPVYMAPEQAQAHALDERADVYAIGAILYEVLSGVWPRRGIDTAQVIAQLIAGAPVTPIEVEQPDVPPDLAAIVRKAMAHDREDRYRTAGELAADLRRFQTGRLVAAHHYSRTTLVRRWLRRHRAAVVVGGVLTLALAVTAVLSVRSLVHERDATRAERDRLILVQARGDLEHDPTAAVAWLKTYPTDAAEPDQAREIALLARAVGVATYVLPLDTNFGTGRFSPDGKRFAQPGAQRLHVLELATGVELQVPRSGVIEAAWAPDSAHLLVMRPGDFHGAIVQAGQLSQVELAGKLSAWRQTNVELFSARSDLVTVLTTEHGLARYPRDGGEPAPVWVPFPLDGYASEGARIASVDRDGQLWWWVPAEAQAHALPAPPGVTLAKGEAVYGFLGDTGRIAAGTTDGGLCVWSLADGSVRCYLGVHGAVTQLAIARDGKTVVALSADHALAQVHPDDGTSEPLPALGELNDIGISGDGRWLAAAHDRELVLVDLRTREHRQIGRHPASVVHIALSGDGRWLASDGEDGTTRLWRLPEDEVTVFSGHTGAVRAVALSPDGKNIAAVGEDHLVSLWSADGRERHSFKDHGEALHYVGFVGHGSMIVTGGIGGLPRTWDVDPPRAHGAALDAGAGGLVALVTSVDNLVVAAAYRRGEVRVWDLATTTSRVVARDYSKGTLAVSPGGAWLAYPSAVGGVRLVASSGTAPRLTDPRGPDIFTVGFSPDGRRLAAGGVGGEVIVWDLATGARRSLEARRGAAYRLAFSRDGRWLAVTSKAGDAGLWDLETGVGKTLRGHAGSVTWVAFPEGDGALLTAGSDGTIRRWRLPGGELESILRLPGGVSALDLDRAGQQLVAASSNGLVYRWPLTAFGRAGAARELPGFLDDLTRASLDASMHLGMR